VLLGCVVKLPAYKARYETGQKDTIEVRHIAMTHNCPDTIFYLSQSQFLSIKYHNESALNPSHPDNIRPIKTREQEL
jgi:hypothetical protein